MMGPCAHFTCDNKFSFLSSSLWLYGVGITSSMFSTPAAPPPCPHGQSGPPTRHVVDDKRGGENYVILRERVDFVLSLSSLSVRDLLVRR